MCKKRVIIITNLEELNEKTAKNLYVGLSRARAKLIIISKKEIISQLKELI